MSDHFRDIVNCLQNESNWKEKTRYVEVRSKDEALRIAEALNYFLGGSEITSTEREVSTRMGGTIVQVFWKVGSKGYYHYIGA